MAPTKSLQARSATPASRATQKSHQPTPPSEEPSSGTATRYAETDTAALLSVIDYTTQRLRMLSSELLACADYVDERLSKLALPD